MKITKEEAKEVLPIVKALAEGKKIQDKIEGLTEWVDTDEINLEFEGQKIKHRIKPEHKYRPFKTPEECWDEMHKHPDFGWIKNHNTGYLCQINCFYYGNRIGIDCNAPINFGCAFDDYLFPDGTPFGIKEE